MIDREKNPSNVYNLCSLQVRVGFDYLLHDTDCCLIHCYTYRFSIFFHLNVADFLGTLFRCFG